MTNSGRRCESWTLKAVRLLCALAALTALVVQPARPALALDQRRLVLSPQAKAIVEANRPETDETPREGLLALFSNLLYDYTDFRDEPNPNRLRMDPAVSGEAGAELDEWSISRAKAVEEVDLLFGAMKYGYAGYQFFGGDEVFETAKSRILKEMSQYSQSIPLWNYSHMIATSLEFIQDGHFAIGNRSPCQWHTFRVNPYLRFFLDDDGRFVNGNGIRLASINRADPSSFLKPSIDEYGGIVYVLGMLVPDQQADLMCELEYEDGSMEMAWLVPIVSLDHGGPVYELGEVEGLPLLSCRSFDSVSDEDQSLIKFVQDADKLRHEKVILLDLRSNHGGSTVYGMLWCQRLMKGSAGLSTFTAELATDTAIALNLNRLAERRQEELGADEIKAMRMYWKNAEDPSRQGWCRISIEHGRQTSNAPFIVVIVDSNTGSATEALVRRLRSVDNVAIIGTNTRGALLCGNTGIFALPHSGLEVRIPTMLWLDSEMQNRDGMGYLPDFWVHPDHALEYGVKFVKKHLVPDQGAPR
jgi:hypothetical protein